MPEAHKQDNSADDSEKGGHLMNESDVGSGEKTPGEKETDEQIRQIPKTIPDAPKEAR